MNPDQPTNPNSAAASSTPAPYGLLGSIAWTAAGIAAWFLAQFALLFAYIAWREAVAPGSIDLKALGHDGTVIASSVILAAPVWIGVMVLAARRRGWSAQDYLALTWPKRSEILFGVACLVPLLAAFDLFTYAIGREVVPPFMHDSYVSAKAGGSLPLFFIAVVIVGPLGEEIAFRGFMFRGLSTSWIGIAGTLFLTSALWSALHVQYGLIEITQIFLIGLLLGWLRWASGSTLLTIMLHMLANLGATLEAAIKVEWLS